MFDLTADWMSIAKTLGADPFLADWIKDKPGIRLPGCWSGFELVVRAILGQQITVKGATTLAGRMVKAFGRPFTVASGVTHLFPAPEVLAEADLTGIGVTKMRSFSIRHLARAFCAGKIRFDATIDPQAALNQLCEIPGIGPWTAQYTALRVFSQADAFPRGDSGLLRCLHIKTPEQLARRAEAWRPWRGYAVIYIWAYGKHTRESDLSYRPAKMKNVSREVPD